MQRVSPMSVFGRGRGARPLGMRVGNLDAQVRAALFGQGQAGYMLAFDKPEGVFTTSAADVQSGAGSPIGLVLDQRFGLRQGGELVVDGTFQSPIGTNWADVSTAPGNTTISGGQLVLANVGGNAARAQQVNATFTAGLAYLVEFDVAGATVGFYLNNESQGSYAVGHAKVLARPTVTGNIIGFRNFAADTTARVSNLTIKQVPGNHFAQLTATTARPTRQQDSQGFWYANFDGVDDALASVAAVPFSAYNTVTALAAYTNGVFLEVTAQASNTDGAFRLSSGATTTAFTSRGTAYQAAVINHADITGTKQQAVGQANISTPVVRVSGPFGGSFASSAAQGTGNYSNAIHYLGARAGNTGYVAGGLYGLLVVSSVLNDREIALARAWARSKMGA